MDCYIQAQGHSDGHFIDCECSIVGQGHRDGHFIDCEFSIVDLVCWSQCTVTKKQTLCKESESMQRKWKHNVASLFAPGLVISNSTSQQ